MTIVPIFFVVRIFFVVWTIDHHEFITISIADILIFLFFIDLASMHLTTDLLVSSFHIDIVLNL